MDLDLLGLEKEFDSSKGVASLKRNPFGTKYEAVVSRGELDNDNVEADLRLRTQIISAQALALSIMGAELDGEVSTKKKTSGSGSKEQKHNVKKEQEEFLFIVLDEDILQEKLALAVELEKAGKDGAFPVAIARTPKAYLDALAKKRLANETERKGKEKSASKAEDRGEEEEEEEELEKEKAMCDVSRFKRLIRPFSFSATRVSPEAQGVCDLYEYGDGGMWETDAVSLLLHDEQFEEEDVVVEEMDDEEEEEEEEMVINKRGGKRATPLPTKPLIAAAATPKTAVIREEGGGEGRGGASVVSSVRTRMQATTTTTTKTTTVSPASKTSRKVASVGEEEEGAIFGLPPSLCLLKENVSKCFALKDKASKPRRLILKEDSDLLRPTPVHRTTHASLLSCTAYRQFVAAACTEEEEALETLQLTRLGKWPFECAVPRKARQLFAHGGITIGLGFDFECSSDDFTRMGVGLGGVFGDSLSIEREEVIGLDSEGGFSLLEEQDQWDEGMVVDVAYMPFEDVDITSSAKEKEESVRKRAKNEDSIMPVCFDSATSATDQNLSVSSSPAPGINTLPRVSIAKCQMWLKAFVSKPPQESIVDLAVICPLQGLCLEAKEEIKRRCFLALIALSEAYNRVSGQQIKGKDSVQLQMRLSVLPDRHNRDCIKVTFESS